MKVNMVDFVVKHNENTYPKGRALMQMYIVVPITKRGNYVGPVVNTCFIPFSYLFCECTTSFTNERAFIKLSL